MERLKGGKSHNLKTDKVLENICIHVDKATYQAKSYMRMAVHSDMGKKAVVIVINTAGMAVMWLLLQSKTWTQFSSFM